MTLLLMLGSHSHNDIPLKPQQNVSMAGCASVQNDIVAYIFKGQYVQTVTLIFDLASCFMFAIHHFVMMIICAKIA